MAIVLNTEADNTSSLNNEMLFVAYEATKAIDPLTYVDYAYVCDVYIDSSLIGRVISRPDPTHDRGIFDIAPILRSYASYGLNASAQTVDFAPYISYRLKFGEQYGATLYTNLLVDPTDRRAFTTYKTKPFLSTQVLGSALASNRPDPSYYHRNQAYFLLPFYQNATGAFDLDILYKDAAGNTVGTDTVNSSMLIDKGIRQVNIINTPPPSTAEYISLTQVSAGPVFTARVNLKCSKYPVYTIAWLNPYGAYESQSFGMVSKKMLEMEKKSFEQTDYRINASGEVSYSENNVFYGGKRGFANKVKVSMNLTTELLTDDEYTWLADLFKSTDVYIYDTVNSKFLPVIIRESSYEYRTYLNSRLQPIKFTVELSADHNSQFL